jgi:tetratricopeptide (TPR) repeat protein
LYNDSGQYDKALNAYSQVTILAPDLSTGWSNMGKIYYSQGKWSECLAEYEKAIKLEPKALYYSNRGVAYFFLGRYAESATDFEQAVKMSPTEAGYHANLADAPLVNRQDLATDSYGGHQTGCPGTQVNPTTRTPWATSRCLRQDRQQNYRLAIDRARSKLNANNIDLMYTEATIHALAGCSKKRSPAR